MTVKTPILLIIFNRFDTTKQVLHSLRKAGVEKLYIYSDGARKDKDGEEALLREVQEQVLNEIDWECRITTHFSKMNEGPRLAIGHAINWFFEQEEEGIILEHDCVPAASFYPFCETLLEYYRHDERVMHISGDNFQFGKKWGNDSYYFSNITHIWGFATWKRAWQYYDVDMMDYPDLRDKGIIEGIIQDNRSRKFWHMIFDGSYQKKIDSWDYQWTFCVWKHKGLSILPDENLVSNIGFDNQALNTTDPNHQLANMKTGSLKFPLKHPAEFKVNAAADKHSMDKVFNPSYLTYFLSKIKNWFGIV